MSPFAVGAPDHLLGGQHVVRVGRADEAVGRDAQAALRRQEESDHLVDEGLGRHGSLGRLHGDVDRVLVGPGQEAGRRAAHPVPAGDDVAGHDLVERVDARLVVGVGDGRGQVVTLAPLVAHGPPSLAGPSVTARLTGPSGAHRGPGASRRMPRDLGPRNRSMESRIADRGIEPSPTPNAQALRPPLGLR